MPRGGGGGGGGQRCHTFAMYQIAMFRVGIRFIVPKPGIIMGRYNYNKINRMMMMR